MEELAAMMVEIEQAVDSNTQNTMEVNDNVQTVIEKVEYGDQKMNSMLEAMDEINTMSNQIGKIVKNIEDIAFQTNILVLNTAVEATINRITLCFCPAGDCVLAGLPCQLVELQVQQARDLQW